MSLLAFLPLVQQAASLFGGGQSSCHWCARDGKWECSQGCPNGQGGDGCCIEPPTVAAAATTATTGTGSNLDQILAGIGLRDLLTGTTPATASTGAGAGIGAAVPQDTADQAALTGAAVPVAAPAAAPASALPLVLVAVIVGAILVWYLTHRKKATA